MMVSASPRIGFPLRLATQKGLRDKIPLALRRRCLVDEHGEQNVRIPIFVLSCRVFGYGFETAMLNAIVRNVQVGSESQPPVIVGAFRETSHNQPCRQMYPDYGFRWDDTAWVLDGEPRPDPQDPAWLTITSELPTPALRP
jgi:hypothetical protein